MQLPLVTSPLLSFSITLLNRYNRYILTHDEVTAIAKSRSEFARYSYNKAKINIGEYGLVKNGLYF
jgi:hypothetical protein